MAICFSVWMSKVSSWITGKVSQISPISVCCDKVLNGCVLWLMAIMANGKTSAIQTRSSQVPVKKTFDIFMSLSLSVFTLYFLLSVSNIMGRTLLRNGAGFDLPSQKPQNTGLQLSSPFLNSFHGTCRYYGGLKRLVWSYWPYVL